MKRYKFFIKSGKIGEGTVDFLWDECTTREEWHRLFKRLNQYLKKRSQQTKREYDWSCPVWETWCRLNPLPVVERKPILHRTINSTHLTSS